MRRCRLYISGPMTGLPEWNYPAFHAAADRLRGLGYYVSNPADNFGGSPDDAGGREAYMREDFKRLLDVDGVVLLPGWRDSRGARAEVLVATELGLKFHTLCGRALMAIEPPVIHTEVPSERE